ncbi:uncharacterized protein LOC107038148 [Diachasma alloeum]|uniref:uncharacterized protein LOC107038148 n=1 Tax=Diachasma alloeum TaxID=454923 RepID=UPI000738381C|nr:uncharacterized protein LOC107038148 [Diachasma alloeum]
MIREIKTGTLSEDSWLGNEFKEQRKVVWRNLREYLKKGGADEKKRLTEAKAALKRIFKDKVRELAEEKKERIRKSRNMSDFWKGLNSCRVKKRRAGQDISEQRWVDRMAEVLGDTDVTREEEPEWECWEEWHELEALDKDISWFEFSRALNRLKNGKAAGEDGIPGEFLKNMSEAWRKELCQVIQSSWESGSLRDGWNVARIFPIHKGGDEQDVCNYRPISVLNLGYKLLASIMTQRLNDWIEDNDALKESQGEFRRRRGTREQVFILNSLIGNRIKRPGGKLYVAFLDLKAAFDTVDRDLLMEKLWKLGIRGRFYDMVKSIYKNTVNEVITGVGISSRFSTGRAMRQGCPLSPLLFNLFLDDIDTEWEKLGGFTVISEHATDLSEMLKKAEAYVIRNKLEINVKKTKVLVFRNGGRQVANERWFINGEELETVSRFKYLGFGSPPRTLWASIAGLSTLKSRLYILSTLGKAGALYCGEIWGLVRREPIERVQGKVVKMGMGITRNTPAYIWTRESQRGSLELEMRRRALKYIGEIWQLEEDRLIRTCLKEELRTLGNGCPSAWGRTLLAALKEQGDEEVYNKLYKGEMDKEAFDEWLKEHLDKQT